MQEATRFVLESRCECDASCVFTRTRHIAVPFILLRSYQLYHLFFVFVIVIVVVIVIGISIEVIIFCFSFHRRPLTPP